MKPWTRCQPHGKRACWACLFALNPFFVPEHIVWNFLLSPLGVKL